MKKNEIVRGCEVKNIITEVVGIVVGRSESLNGTDPNKMPKTEYQPCQYLKIKIEDKKVETDSDDRGGSASEAPKM